MPYGPPLYGIFWGHIFCKYGGGGGQNYFQKRAFSLRKKPVSEEKLSEAFAHERTKVNGSEDALGGGKRGVWKTLTNDTPPKKGFRTPPRTVRFPPPSGVSALFSLYKNPRQSRPEALLEGSKNFRESAFSGTFSSPHGPKWRPLSSGAPPRAPRFPRAPPGHFHLALPRALPHLAAPSTTVTGGRDCNSTVQRSKEWGHV